jgi:methyl-accepting chemotaxis protein
VVVETAVLLYICVRAHKEAVQSEELYAIGSHLLAGSGTIDLSYRHPNASSRFVRDFNQFMEALHNSMARAADAAERLLQTTARLQQVTDETASGVQQEQTDIHEVADAVEQMTNTTQEMARNAGSTASATHQADLDAHEGSRILQQTIDAISALAEQVDRAGAVIQRLDEEGEKIGSVLDVIKGVAEQTNLLALNAAIEAARAGDLGRGFAVVADEVRTLASRTQSSTHEIEGMIERLQSGTGEAVKAMEVSHDQAHTGVEQAQQAGAALRSILQSIATISEMSNMIAAAAEQQHTATEGVDRRILNIGDVADRSAHGAEEVARATEELGRLAAELGETVRAFKL